MRAECRHPHADSCRERRPAADRIRGVVADRDLREDDDRPSRPRDDGAGQLAREGLDRVAVGVRRQVRPMLLEDAAGNDDNGALPIERLNLPCVQVRELVDLRGRVGGGGHHTQGGHGGRRGQSVLMAHTYDSVRGASVGG